MDSRKALLQAAALTLLVGLIAVVLFGFWKPPKQSWLVTENGYLVRVPAGFTIERVASNEVQYPMLAVFDERGRLFITESSGKNVKGRDMPKQPECRISVLEDRDGDGFFERQQVFADNLSLPMGAHWQGNSLYVASPPDFFRLEDANDDGVAERREVVLTGWNILNTASLHGPFPGPDGWLYLTHGRHGYKIQTKEGALLEGLAARIWRCRPDGTGLERVCGGGFDNPVELVFTPAGEMLGTMTYFMDPANGQRDALMHFVEGGVYPKPHPSTAEFKRTGDLMPVMTKFARIAPSGLLQYRSASFGPEYQGNLFTAQFNPHRLQRHILIREGATFRTEDTDFVTSDDPDFHPTDVMEDADGSLVFLDTGGWYVDACPLSKYAKAERRGAVYRIRKAGVAKVEDPHGVNLKLETLPSVELAQLLADARPAVRDRSLELLVTKGEASVPALVALREQTPSPEVRCAVVFALGRIATPAALQAVRAALNDADFQVRSAAARVAGMTRDVVAVERLSEMVKRDELPARRQAATSLGQIGERNAAPALLAAAADAQDRFVEHAIIYALIELKEPAALLTALNVAAPRTRKAALIALDQMDGSPLQQGQVTPLLAHADAELRRAAVWVIGHHKDWGGAVLEFLRTRLSAPKLDARDAEAVSETLLAFTADVQIQRLAAAALTNAALPVERQLFLLDTLERCALKQLPNDWLSGLAGLLKAADPRVRARALTFIRARRVAALDDELNQIALNASEPADLRLAAFGIVTARNPRLGSAALDFLLGLLAAGGDPALRLSAAQTLGQAELTREQLLPLAQRYLPKADSLTLQPLLEIFRKSTDESVGQALLNALQSPTLNLEALGGKRIEQLFKPFPVSVRNAAQPLLARFQSEEAVRVQRLQALEPLLTFGGDAGQGRRIFFSPKAACASCHTIGPEGGHVGPDLTSVGAIRSGHDILEAIVFPNATLVPGHETRRIETKTGREPYNGVISELESDRAAVVLLTGPREKLRIPRDEIVAITPSSVSLMPEGFATQLSQLELRDLLAFLRAQK